MAGIEKLTDIAIRKAKSREKPYRLSDGGGLAVLIHQNGSKYWELRYTAHGKENRAGLGKYPDVTLTAARKEAKRLRGMVADDRDPVIERRKEALEMRAAANCTLKAVAVELIDKKAQERAPSYIRSMRLSLARDVYAKIGSLPIQEITPPMILEVLKAIEKRGALERLQKVRGWLRQIFNYAAAIGLRKGDNPVTPLTGDVLRRPNPQNYPTFVNRADAGSFLRRLVEYQGRQETAIAVQLQMLLAVRPGELRAATWSEFDTIEGIWRIPAERMKMRRPHEVPLSKQAISALAQLRELTGRSRFLFPGYGADRDKPISEMTLTKAFRLLWPEYRVVPHGSRHFFSTHANESGLWRSDVIEQALAHEDKNQIRGKYNKATYLVDRRRLMQWWANELESMRKGGKVVRLNDSCTVNMVVLPVEKVA